MATPDNISKFYKAFNDKYDNFASEQEFRDYLAQADSAKMQKLFHAFSEEYDNFHTADEMKQYLGYQEPVQQKPTPQAPRVKEEYDATQLMPMPKAPNANNNVVPLAPKPTATTSNGGSSIASNASQMLAQYNDKSVNPADTLNGQASQAKSAMEMLRESVNAKATKPNTVSPVLPKEDSYTEMVGALLPGAKELLQYDAEVKDKNEPMRYEYNIQKAMNDADGGKSAVIAWENADKAVVADQKSRMNVATRGLSDGKKALVMQNMMSMEPVCVRADRMTEYQLKKVMDDAWDNVDNKEELVSGIADAIRSSYGEIPNIDAQAEIIARHLSDQRVLDEAIRRNRPKSEIEYLLRRVAEDNTITKLCDAVNRSGVKNTDYLRMRELAMQGYVADKGLKGKALELGGTVLNISTDMVTYIAGGTSQFALRGFEADMVRQLGAEGARAVGGSIGTKIVQGAIGGSVNFATFETANEAVEQLKWGGVRDENGNVLGYQPGRVAERGIHGALLGGTTGVFAPVFGNVSTRATKATQSTTGKGLIRAGELVGGTVAEGTIFTVGDILSGNKGDRSVLDVWTDNMAMMIAFKGKHVLTSAPARIAELKKTPENLGGFETRLRKVLDGHPSLALTKDEKAELEANGYGDLTELVEAKKELEYELSKSNDKAQGRVVGAERMIGNAELPYNRFAALVQDGRVSEAARAKMYYYLTGNQLTMSTIIGSVKTEDRDENGNVLGYTVKSIGANGTITCRYYKNNAEADAEVGRINRQAELNTRAVGERYYDSFAEYKRQRKACEEFANEKGLSVDIVLELMKRPYESMSEGQRAWADEINAKLEGINADQVNHQSLMKEVGEKYGVDVDKACNKEPNRRSKNDVDAVKEYIERLFPEEAKRMESDEPTPNEKGYQADEQEREDIFTSASADNADERSSEELDGVVRRINDEADYYVAMQRDAFGRMMHKDGTLRPVKLKGDDGSWYLLDGEVEMKDGDVVGGSSTVVVYNAETGEKKQIDPKSPTGIESLDKVSTQDEIEQTLADMRAEFVKNSLDEATGKVNVQPGMPFTLPDGRNGVVEMVDEENAYIRLEDGTRTPVSLKDMQEVADQMRVDEYNERHGKTNTESESVNGTESTIEGGFAEGLPEAYEPNMEVILKDEDGTQRQVAFMGMVRAEGLGNYVPDENGRIVEYYDNGDVRHMNIDEFNSKVVAHEASNVEDVQNSQGAVETTGGEPIQEVTAKEEPMPVEETAKEEAVEEPEATQEVAETEAVEEDADAMPLDKNGNPVWSAVTPKRAHKYFYEDLGLESSESDMLVDAQVDAAEKDLKKAQKAFDKHKNTKTTNIRKYISDKAKLQQAVDDAEKNVAYWNEVKALSEADRAERKAAQEAEVARVKAEALQAKEQERFENRMAILQKIGDRHKLIETAKKIYGDYFNDDMFPTDIYEMVAENLPYGIAWENLSDSRTGLKYELGSNISRGVRGDMNFGKYIAKKGEGISFNQAVMQVYESGDNSPVGATQPRYDDTEIRDAILDMFMTHKTQNDIKNYVVWNRINDAEEAINEAERRYIEENDEDARLAQMEYEESALWGEWMAERAKEVYGMSDEEFNALLDGFYKEEADYMDYLAEMQRDVESMNENEYNNLKNEDNVDSRAENTNDERRDEEGSRRSEDEEDGQVRDRALEEPRDQELAEGARTGEVATPSEQYKEGTRVGPADLRQYEDVNASSPRDIRQYQDGESATPRDIRQYKDGESSTPRDIRQYKDARDVMPRDIRAYEKEAGPRDIRAYYGKVGPEENPTPAKERAEKFLDGNRFVWYGINPEYNQPYTWRVDKVNDDGTLSISRQEEDDYWLPIPLKRVYATVTTDDVEVSKYQENASRFDVSSCFEDLSYLWKHGDIDDFLDKIKETRDRIKYYKELSGDKDVHTWYEQLDEDEQVGLEYKEKLEAESAKEEKNASAKNLAKLKDEDYNSYIDEVRRMSDDELLSIIREQGSSATDPYVFEPYEEYDARHQEEYSSSYDMTFSSITSEEEANNIASRALWMFKNGDYCSTDRASVRGQIDAALDKIDTYSENRSASSESEKGEESKSNLQEGVTFLFDRGGAISVYENGKINDRIWGDKDNIIVHFNHIKGNTYHGTPHGVKTVAKKRGLEFYGAKDTMGNGADIIIPVENGDINTAVNTALDIIKEYEDNRARSKSAKENKLSIAERELGSAVAEHMSNIGVETHADVMEYQHAVQEAKKDKSEAGKPQFFIDNNGKRYGFVQYGKIYLDPRMLNAELPLHEYSHLWCKALELSNSEEWNRVVDMMKQNDEVWNDVKRSMQEGANDNDIASEMISRYSGKRGAERLQAEVERLMEGKEEESVRSIIGNALNNIAKAIQDFWKSVGDFLGIKYESAEQVADQIMRDFANKVNPRTIIERYIKEQDKSYADAVERGDMKEATRIFNNTLAETIGNGAVPFIYADRYRKVQSLAHGVKSRDAETIDKAAELMAPLVPENAVLIPMVSHTGKATDMLDLANAIAKKAGCDVADILESDERASQYETKRDTGKPMTASELGIRMKDGATLPEGKIPVVVDNVVNSGNTASAAIKALGKGVVLSLASSKGDYKRVAELKSANVVERDKEGNVIPLSDRFNILSGEKQISEEELLNDTESKQLATEAVVEVLGDYAGIDIEAYIGHAIDNKDAEILKDSEGKVYGWVDGNTIHLTEDGINPNTPIHEYTHLWAKAVGKNAPELWDNVKELMKQTSLWNEVLEDKNYTDIHGDEDAVASEVLSRLSGSKNAERMTEEAQRMIDEADGIIEKAEAYSLIDRIKRALNDFWNWVGTNLFGMKKFDSADQVADRVLWDMVNKTDLKLDGSEGGVEMQKVSKNGRKGEKGNPIKGSDIAKMEGSFNEDYVGKKECEAIADYLNNDKYGADVYEQLKKHQGTPWAKRTIEATLIRVALNDLLAGRTPVVNSYLTKPTSSGNLPTITRMIMRNGEDGLWRYISHESGVIGNPDKCVNAVDGSYLNCRPSDDCAKFCYASGGNYQYSGKSIKSELTNWALNKDPKRLANMIASEYKATWEYSEGKALRLFDKGDISEAWLPVVEELNNQGIVCQIFSKRPEIIDRIDESKNVIMMSIDKSNLHMLEQYPELPIAFVYTNKEDSPLLNTLKERFEKHGGSILPVKIGNHVLPKEEIDAIPTWAQKYTCPIDKGTKTIGTNLKIGEWNCTACDKGGGVGCFFKRTAQKLKEQYERDNRQLRSAGDNSAETGATTRSMEGIPSLHGTNLPQSDSDLRRGLLDVIRESGVSDADVQSVLLENMVDWLRRGMERRDGERLELGAEESADATRVDREEGRRGSRSKRRDGDVDKKFREQSPYQSGEELVLHEYTDENGRESYRFEGQSNGYFTKDRALDMLRDQYSDYAFIEQEDGKIVAYHWRELLKPRKKKADAERNNAEARRFANNAEKAISQVAGKMGIADKVTVLYSLDGLDGRMAKAKGWYDEGTGKIVVVLPNNNGVYDVVRTMMHEGVAHYGLRKMFGKDFDTFLDNVYNNVNQELRDAIDERMERSGAGQREATEELLADLAETYDMRSDNAQSWMARAWRVVMKEFMDMLRKVGASFGFKFNSDDLRYILWRSYRNMVDETELTADNAREQEIDARMRYDLGIDESNIRFRDGDDVFYSNAEKALESIKQEKATPEQWLKMLEKNGGLKAGEDKWIGLSDWLKEQDGKTITRQDIADYLAKNIIRIKDVEYVDLHSSAMTQKLTEYLKKHDVPQKDIKDIIEYLEVMDGRPTIVEADLFGEYQDLLDKFAPRRRYRFIEDRRRHFTTKGLSNNKEVAIYSPQADRYNADDFVHFGDAGNGDTIAWARFGDAKDSEGNNVLVIDEIQSKRHQKGRKIGYNDNSWKKDVEKINKERIGLLLSKDEVNELYTYFPKKKIDYFTNTTFERIELYESQKYQSLTDSQKARADELLEKFWNERELSFKIFDIEREARKQKLIPPAPFEKNWHELTMKRVLRYAAENGYDKVAWTTGEQQNARYHIGAKIDNVRCSDWVIVDDNSQDKSFSEDYKVVRLEKFDDNNDASLFWSIYINKNGDILFAEDMLSHELQDAPGKQLSDIVGKNIADKIMASKGEEDIPVDDLRLGGEGMKGFYDEILPRFIDKYGKKWGVKTKDVELNLPSEADRVMHSVDVTPEMKESVMQGQPMFRRSEEIEAEYPNWLGETKNDNGGDNTQIAGTIRSYEKYGDYIKKNNPDASVLDASSGFGYGTEAMREMGLNVDDVEPYPNESKRKNAPIFGSYDDVDKQYDYVISNAVINVIPDDWRHNVMQNMAKAVKVGGRLIINTRGAEEVTDSNRKNWTMLDNDREWLTRKNGKINSYQKFYTPQELIEYVQDELGDGWTVERANKANSGLSGARAAVVATKNSEESVTANDKKSAHATELGKQFNTPITIIDDVTTIVDDNKVLEARKRRSKGWYDTRTGEVVIIPSNNKDVEDVASTLFHEVVAHKGLRELVGEENYEAFLGDVFDHATEEVRAKIAQKASKHGWDFNKATDEYLGDLAEKGFEDFDKGEKSLWESLKQKVLDAINKFLGSLKLPKWVRLGDNELRYMLWKSKNNLNGGGGGGIIEMAEDVAKRAELGLIDNVVFNGSVDKIDAEYKNAIERGDFDKAKEIVTKAAINAGYTVEAYHGTPESKYSDGYKDAIEKAFLILFPNEQPINKNAESLTKESSRFWDYANAISRDIYKLDGKLPANVVRVIKQGTKVRFNTFDINKFGKSTNANDSKGFFFSPDENFARNFTQTFETVWPTGKTVKTSHGDGFMYHVYLKPGKVLDLTKMSAEDSKEAQKNQMRKGWEDYDMIINKVKDNHPLGDKKVKIEISVKDPERIKLADVVVYDDDGNIVPLSERFNDNYDDIRFRDGEEESLGMYERISAVTLALAEKHQGDARYKNDAIRAISENLADLRKAASLQREFDRSTTKRVGDLARLMLQSDMLSDMSKGEVKRLVSDIVNATGRADIKQSVNTLMDIMLDNQLRNAEKALDSLEKIKGSKVNAKGVQVQGELDLKGQAIVKSFKEGIKMDSADLEEEISKCEDKIGSENAVESENASIALAGLTMARTYVDEIKHKEAEMKSLREELANIDPNDVADYASARELKESIEDAIRENKAERIEAYSRLVASLGGTIKASIEDAKAFAEKSKERVADIHHNANSDLKGVECNEHLVNDNEKKGLASDVANFFLSPVCTFDQMLRYFGSKSANGEGYLYNRFMRGLIDARNAEIEGMERRTKTLDAKARELFADDNIKDFGGLRKYVNKLPGINIEIMNGGAKQEVNLSQGSMMYIYMVDKMSDGRMKLRKMGIDEDAVSTIVDSLDPRLVELADWMQNTFLVDTRNDYNETHQRMFGAPMKSVDNYFPLKILARGRAVKAEDLDNNYDNNGISTETGAIKTRTRNTIPLDVLNSDALQVVLDHVAEMEHWNAFAEYNRDLNSLRTYSKFRNKLANMNTIYGRGEELYKNFNKVCQLATGSYRKERGSAVDKSVVNIAKGMTSAAITFRINTALKQLLSAPAFYTEVKPKYMAEAMVKPCEAWSWAMENLPIIRERWSSRISGDPRLLKSNMDYSVWRSNLMQTIGRLGMTPNAFVDALTVCTGAYAVYKSKYDLYKGYGYSEEEAEKRAKQDAAIIPNESQQSTEGAFMSTMQADKTAEAVAFSTFRSASFSYTRKFLENAIREYKLMGSESKAQSIEFMTKQFVRDGIDEEQARQNAEKKYAKESVRNFANMGVFGYVLPILWTLGGSAWLIALSDDDEKRKREIKKALAKGVAGPAEGFAGGGTFSTAVQMLAMDDMNAKYLRNDLPVTSEAFKLMEKIEKKDWYSVSNQLANLVVATGIGVNPQSISDGVLAVMDVCGNDPKLAREGLIFAMRVMQVPRSQIKEIYFEEAGLSGEEAASMTPKQLAERYARYEVKRGRIFTPWGWNDEAAIAKQKKYATSAIKENAERAGDADNKAYEHFEEIYKELDDKRKKANAAKTAKDYEEYRRLIGEFNNDERIEMYYTFKYQDKILDDEVKYYMNSFYGVDAPVNKRAIEEQKHKMVEILQAQEEAIGKSSK